MHDLGNLLAVSKTSKSKTINTSNIIYELEPIRSKRQRIEKSFRSDFLRIFVVEMRDEIDYNFTCLYLIYQEALNSIESSMWKEVIKSELDSLTINWAWNLVDLPKGSKQIKRK